MPDRKKNISISFGQIVTGIIILIMTGIISWVGATVKSKLEAVDDLQKWQVEVNTILNTDLKHTLDDLQSSIESSSAKMGALSGDVKRVEILVNRLDAVVDRLEKAIE